MFLDSCTYFFCTFPTALSPPCHWVLLLTAQVVWGDAGIFLSVCSASAQGQGGTGSPWASPIQQEMLQTHPGWQHYVRGKIFQFKLSGTKLRIAPCSHNEPCSADQISQHYTENKAHVAVCFLGQDQVRKGFLNKTVSSCTNVALSPFNSIRQSTKGNGATSRRKAKPTSPSPDFLDDNSFL